jgi:peptide/nickel transport system substrate-binding protein
MRRLKPAARPTQALAATLLLGLGTILGCGRDRAQPDPKQQPTTLTLWIGGSSFWLLVPPGNFPAMHLMYSPLFRPDRETGEPQGYLVRSWETSEDGLTWTYRLRPDIRWHDGAPLTAHDVAFTYELYSHPEVARWGARDKVVRALDDTTFTITYARFENPLDDWRVYLPRHLLGGLDVATFSEWEYWREPVGYGPYRWVRTAPETLFELEANPEFFAGKPRIERLLLRLGGDPRIEMLAGNVDAVGWPGGPRKPDELESDPALTDFRAHCSVEPSWSVTYLDLRDPILSDARVRRALQHGIDRTEIAAAMDQPQVELFDVPASPRQLRRGETPPPVSFDPVRAAQLLDQAGWSDSDGDGLRDRDGERMRLRAVAQGDAQLFVVMQQQLLGIGIDLQVITEIETVGRERFNNGEAELFDVEGAGAGGLGLLRSLLGREPRNSLELGFDSPELVRLADELERTFDLDERDRIYREMWPIFLEQAPVLFWFRTGYCQVAHRRVRGLSSPYRWSPETSMAELWLEEADQAKGGS